MRRINHLGWAVLSAAAVFGSGMGHAPALQAADFGSPVASSDGSSVPQGFADRYFVHLQEPALGSYRGGINNLAAPERVASRGGQIDARSAASTSYVAYLQQRQSLLIGELNQRLGRQVTVSRQFQHALNAVVVKLSPGEVNAVKAIPGVVRVSPVRLERADTDRGPAFIGAPAIWTGTDTGGLPPTRGEGVVAGIIDSGINFDSPSFAVMGGDAFVHTNPLGSGNFLGTCAVGGVDVGLCNNKLIGAYDFVFDVVCPGGVCEPDTEDEPSAEDGNGHGSHTASTVVGNVATATVSGATVPISGVAPHANVIAYDVCFTEISTGRGLCPTDSSAFAVEQAIADGLVNVLNFSISGGTAPWDDDVSLAFLSAVDSGIYVATSAGNSGPAPDTLGHVEPWTSATAALTHDRLFSDANADVTAPGPVPPALVDIPAVQSSGGVVLGGPVTGNMRVSANTFACTADGGFTGGPFTPGFIAVISRGTCTFAEKVQNATTAGAAGAIIYNNSGAAPIIMSVPATTIPAVMVSSQAGADLAAFIAANTATNSVTFSVSAPPTFTIQASYGDIMASFSSRGPNDFDILKPDIAAPGVAILAAFAGPADSVEFLQGTSMASPHNAGAAALLKALRPALTPSEIRSALTMTSKDAGIFKENGTTPSDPFDRGAGRVDLNRGGRALLVMNETGLRYLQADPADGGDPRNLNVPSIADHECLDECTFTRRVRSVATTPQTFQATYVGSGGSTGTVTPSSFTLNPGQQQTLTITINTEAVTPFAWSFGQVRLTPNTTGTSSITLSNSTAATNIPDNLYRGGFGSATMACRAIDASSIPAANTVTSVSITTALTHTWAGDLVAKLQAPSGSILGVFSRPGQAELADNGEVVGSEFGDSSNLAAAFPLTFADGQPNDAETMGNTIATGGVICQNDSRCNYFPNRGAVAGPPNNFAGFVGQPASGTWTMCVGDRGAGDTGSFGTWSITIGMNGLVPDPTNAHVLPTAVIAVPGSPEITTSPAAINETVAAGASVTVPLTVGNEGGVDLTWTVAAASIPVTVHDQPVAGTNGIVSDFSTFPGNNTGAYTAADFVVTGTSSISTFVAPGFDNGNLLASQASIRWMVFADDGGTPLGDPELDPAPALFNFSAPIGSPGVDITGNVITLNLAAAGQTLTLQPGTYWLSVFPSYSTDIDAAGQARWNWFQGLQIGAEAHLISPILFGGTIDDWASLTSIGLTFPDVAFTITGAQVCGAPWLSTDPDSGTTAPGGTSTINVTLDGAIAGPGTHSANLCITSNDITTPTDVTPVTFTVNAPTGDDIFEDGFEDPPTP